MLKRTGIVAITVCCFVLIAGVLLSTDSYMISLPVYNQYKCAICHKSSSPTDGSDLNLFGEDFRTNGMRWDRTLAEKDSDKDGFSNGMELGDETGDGIPEVTEERSNPGDPANYPSSIDEATWGIIKSIFSEKGRRR